MCFRKRDLPPTHLNGLLSNYHLPMTVCLY